MNFLPDTLLLAASELRTEFPSAGETMLYIVGIVFFLLLNAFFVASEFAIVKVRPSQLEAAAKDKPTRTATALHVVSHLDGYLSANQLGITIASLALGFLGEPFVEALVSPLLYKVGVPVTWEVRGKVIKPISAVSFLLAIASFTFLHVVIGELLPKSIAIRKAVATTLLLAGPLHVFYKTFNWAIRVLNGTANWILKRVIGIYPVAEGERAQEVTETEREILINALELNELWVRDVMTPRQDVIVLNSDEPFEKALEVARRSKHTRFPLVKGGHLDNANGLIHIKDILKLVGSPDPDLMRIKRELKMVPDTMPLDILLKFFLKERAHLAMAVDEFGTPVGIVFLDNVIEELVGDIQDEFDNEHPESNWINDNEFVVEGAMTLNDLASMAEELEIDSGEVTTVGGYITQQLGRFPEVGESIEIEGWEAKVTSTDGRRVGQVHFRRLEPAGVSENGNGNGGASEEKEE
jgi:CBS domain containing-hemolysin-like protein